MSWFERLPEIEFYLDGWRRWAYWISVMFIGVTIGIRAGHPKLDVLPYGIGSVSLTEAAALYLANHMLLVTIALIVLISGREAFVGMKGKDGQ